MPKLLDRAASTLGELSPRAVDLLSSAGFTAAGIAAVMAENLRTATDSDRSLTERARTVGTTSLGAVLSGPTGLSQRGRSLLHRGDGDGDGRGRTRPEATPETTPETTPAPPAGQAARVATSPSAAPEAAGGSAAAVRDLPREPAAPAPPAAGAADPAQQEPVPPRGIDTSSPAAELDVEAAVAEEPAEVRSQRARAGGSAPAAPPAAPAGQGERTESDTIETGLTADLERMTVAQLRARAAEDGIPGRSKMNKTELIAALADREG